jgi:hypothetical protein
MLGDVDFRMLWESRNRPFTVTKMLGAIVSDAYSDPAKIEKRFVYIYELRNLYKNFTLGYLV